MNSFYGVFASSFYRFTHEKLGASITEWARHNITEIISNLEKDGFDVVYSDTDSIFVCTMNEQNIPAKKPESGDELLAGNQLEMKQSNLVNNWQINSLKKALN